MSDFTILIKNWYAKNKRNLPWRQTKNPYFIWLSEVILQQTQVVQGSKYYEAFVTNYPEVELLAKAPQDDVLNLWQGLGYYSRARNLHFAAKQIIEEFDGQFPTNFKSILSLKGVGDYTASAIASIAFNLPHAVVDGNVYRVLSRCFKIDTEINTTTGQKEFKKLAQELLDPKNPGEHNQALMEIGALVCKPQNPLCNECPLIHICLAYQNKSQSQYPNKKAKKPAENRYFDYYIYIENGKTYLAKRDKSSIWAGLYEFPLIESKLKSEPTHLGLKLLFEKKHILTHRIIYARFWKTNQLDVFNKDNYIEIDIDDIEKYPVPQLIVDFLKSNPLFNTNISE